MRFVSKFLLFVFAAFVLMQFVLLQYVAMNLSPQLEFQSNFLNESTPFIVDGTLLDTTVAPLETTTYKRLTRGILLIQYDLNDFITFY